jgi:hypothetical protein
MTNEKKLHIDSNIKITKRYEQKLTDAYDVAEGDFKTLLRGIIDLIKTKKVVNSADIQKIIEDNDLTVSGVYFSRGFSIARGINTNGKWGYCAGNCGPKPLSIIPYVGGIFFWHAIASSWSEVGVNVNVGPDTYTYDHTGWVIGYFGFGSNDWTFDMTYGVRTRFMMGGFGFLIFVSP